MSIEAMKEKARRHEQKEEWHKALDLYLQAIDKLDAAEEIDIGLFNRVGDLEVRMDRVEDAVGHYERAVDLYMDSELPNNAIAVCKKVARNFPDQHSIYLKMGQIRATQGFLTDARQNFLTFAEQKQGQGEIEAALDALIQFVELAPADIEIRLALAEQLAQHDRTEEAVEQFREARRRLILDGREEEAEAAAEKLRELAPDEELADADEIRAAGPAEVSAGAPVEDAWESSFSDFSSDDEPEEEAEAEAPTESGFDEVGPGGEGDAEEEIEADFGEISVGGDESPEDGGEAPGAEEPEETATDEADGLAEEDDEGEPLPTYGFGEEGEDEAEGDLDASAYGVRDEGDHTELPELETDLEDLSGGEADEGEAEAADDVQEAVEEAAFEERAEEEAGDDWLAAVDADAEEAVAEEPVDEEEAPAEDGSERLRERGMALRADGAGEEAAEVLERAHEGFADEGRMDEAMDVLETLIDDHPDDVDLRQRLVEYAYRTSDDEVLVSAYLGLAGTLTEQGQERKARSVYQQVLDADPENEEARRVLDEMGGEARAEPDSRTEVASSEEYVDLGSMVLDEEEEEKSTRFTVPAEAPSGDEQADFARMLDQFKNKVAENVATDDVAAHYDLGTAYKEMGLVDEAIGEFQSALRAARDHLPTYEMLGQCFMEKDQHEAAARTLKKALSADHEVEDELLGIYYFLGRAYEAMGQDEDALEYYDKVFELDINFMDVTERLRELR